jgi:hypothetical protein
MSQTGHKRERRPRRRPASHAAGVPQLADSLLAGREGSALGQLRTHVPRKRGVPLRGNCTGCDGFRPGECGMLALEYKQRGVAPRGGENRESRRYWSSAALNIGRIEVRTGSLFPRSS